ncbi:hypothetical protein [Streptomyces showdoensis]|uniref:Lipoprotein n=1 Tax=Streptomyces showdoensis TaxID=68268 RepID=A0A2P2GJF0_STREW|nr:hypothetical protein [Streptomyces showdoensis]KKZ71646.1 lipoprotein [Streptomyces showdoensis]
MTPSTPPLRTAFRRRYGASPLHLLLLLASFALACYAGVRLLKGDSLAVAAWFAGAALLHDLVLLPLYAYADLALQRALGRRPADRPTRPRPGINHIRVPAFVSGVLLLVYWPLILRQVGHYSASTGLPADVFLGRWLLITACLFAASAAVCAARLWHEGRGIRKAPDRARE